MRTTEQKIAHVEARARWALAGIKTIASLGYAPAREFKRLRYLLERAYALGITSLPPREKIIDRLAALEPRCIANWETEKEMRKKMRQMKPANKETKNPHEASLDLIEAAGRQAVEAKVVRDPVLSEQRRLSDLLAKNTPTHQRERATFRELLPFLDRVLALVALPWSRQDGPQRRLQRAVRLATDIRDIVAKDEVAQLSQEIDDLTADHLRGGWAQHLESRITGLAHSGAGIAQMLEELKAVVAEIAERDLALLGDAKMLSLEIPLPERQAMAITKE